MGNNCKENKNKYNEDKKPCLCECDKLCYNNKNCCYLRSKDINIVQVYDATFFQAITSNGNLYLTAKEPQINTIGYEIESSSLQRPNDTLLINESGVYSIYISLKYSFKFNENTKVGDLFKVKFVIEGNNEEVINISNTITIHEIIDGESKEIVNTVQGKKLQIIEENLPYKLNVLLDEFQFEKAVLNQILITDLVLIVEKIM